MSRYLLLAALLGLAGAARAETINCTPVASLPATLSAPGVYCLRQDLTTAIGSGNAITIAANNVTLDCNGYRIGGLAAGAATRAKGIFADGKVNTVLRNCNVRGFFVGAWVQAGAGHVIEDNRLEGNTYAGIIVTGSDGDLIRNNHLVDTGGNLPANIFPNGAAYGLAVEGSTSTVIAGNTVSGTHATPGSERPGYGIAAYDTRVLIEGNRVTDTVLDGPSFAHGIYVAGNSQAIVRDNSVMNPVATNGGGISVWPGAGVCKDNMSVLFNSGIDCTDAGGNYE